MLEETPKSNGRVNGNEVRPDKQHRRLAIAIVLLLCALIVVLIKDHEYWFGGEETAAPEQEQQVQTTPAAPAEPQAQPAAAAPAAPAETPTKHVKKHSTSTGITTTTAHAVPNATVNSVKVEPTPKTAAKSDSGTTADHVQMASIKAPLPADYPLLGGQMSVQGSVLLQVLIAANGAVEDLRILSGPTILVSAAREAVKQWRFKPFYENGKPVETQARVTVNFTINVSNTSARNQQPTITSDGAI